MSERIYKAKEMIKKGNVGSCISYMIDFGEEFIVSDIINSDFYQEVLDRLVLLNSRYNILTRKIKEGIIAEEYATLENNKIMKSLIACVSHLEKKIKLVQKNAMDITDGDSDKGVMTEVKTSGIELTITGSLESYTEDEKEDLLRAIGVLINLDRAEIVVRKIQNGSIKMTIEIPVDKIESLLSLVDSGLLSAYNVKSAKKSKIIEDQQIKIIDRFFEKNNEKLLALAKEYVEGSSLEPEELVQLIYSRMEDVDEGDAIFALENDVTHYMKVIMEHLVKKSLKENKGKT